MDHHGHDHDHDDDDHDQDDDDDDDDIKNKDITKDIHETPGARPPASPPVVSGKKNALQI